MRPSTDQKTINVPRDHPRTKRPSTDHEAIRGPRDHPRTWTTRPSTYQVTIQRPRDHPQTTRPSPDHKTIHGPRLEEFAFEKIEQHIINRNQASHCTCPEEINRSMEFIQHTLLPNCYLIHFKKSIHITQFSYTRSVG